ncbi:alanine dehydrogenase [Naegleria gruberi]|uniref:Alanine dehydrogenase n=1 Tax=Naegleria gruberi TaxID=5762 RepID=D2VA82_NAEGR|nr:alanine dehydrogenase [Naegleria gruberi]EFC46262.1 alanine dehydrogenase [Naegleria gruberi]|eukprot:XP_002679006.1 alanine dehydrogenase [Naegleria gruberi strain NEG-M]
MHKLSKVFNVSCNHIAKQQAIRQSCYKKTNIISLLEKEGRKQGFHCTVFNSRLRKYSESGETPTIGIRREDKNVWERRVPLTPSQCEELIKEHGIRIVIQPSTTRAFGDEEYREAGCEINEDLSIAQTILAVKEVPAQLLIPNKTYMFFSHTIKGQWYNMNMLDTILEKKIRLIDYERIVKEVEIPGTEKTVEERLVRFGPFAGNAGVIDTLHILGERLLTQYGYTSPFLSISYARNYISLEICKHALNEIGRKISQYGINKDLFPMTFVMTGKGGSVCHGMKEMIQQLQPPELTHKTVEFLRTPQELRALWEKKARGEVTKEDCRKIYILICGPEYMVKHKSQTQPFDKYDYYANPQDYEPIFHETIIPYTKVLLNGMYWDARYPRLITNKQAKQLIDQNRFPLICVGDVSCDPGGSVEFLTKTTTISSPVYVNNIKEDKILDDTVIGEGVAMLAVDHLPAEFPRSSSSLFGSHLFPFIPDLARSFVTMSSPLETQMKYLPTELRKAVITSGGKLTPNFEYIDKIRGPRSSRVLILGSGYVVPPIIDYLIDNPRDIATVTVASDKISSEFKSKYSDSKKSVEFVSNLNVTNDSQLLADLISKCDIVLSLVPAPLHPIVAQQCLKYEKHLVTASYISPEMEQLNEQAKEKGLLFINEIGLDPGIDHMCIMKTLDQVVGQRGGKVESFKSFCGALPAPESSDNPLGYKFSWSPIGVLRASQNPCLFMKDGEVVNVTDGNKLTFLNEKVDVKFKGFNFEVIPNRDSLKYISKYKYLNEKDLKTMMRGTLRFGGFCEVFRLLTLLGYLNQSTVIPADAKTYRDIFCTQLGVPVSTDLKTISAKVTSLYNEKIDAMFSNITDKYQQAIYNRLKANAQTDVSFALKSVKQLGLLSTDSFGEKPKSGLLLDLICTHLEKELALSADDKDLNFMVHEFIVNYEKENVKEKITSTVCVYGDKKEGTATSRTVGLPVAITAVLVAKESAALKKSVGGGGVIGPTSTPLLYEGVLSKLEQQGITVEETVEPYEEM